MSSVLLNFSFIHEMSYKTHVLGFKFDILHMHGFLVCACVCGLCRCVFLHTCSYQTLILFAPASASITAGELYFRHFQGSVYYTLLYPVADCLQKMDDDDNPFLVCFCGGVLPVCLCHGRNERRRERGDEGSLGKALQIRSNYSSLPLLLSVPYWTSPAPCEQVTLVLYSTMFSCCLVICFFCSFVFRRHFLSTAFCALFSCACRSTSANGVYIGSHDRLCS